MIHLTVEHNLYNIINRINSIQNDIQEAISRTFSDHSSQMYEDLISRFGENLRYAQMELVFSGSEFSIKFSNVNEYALRDRSGATAEDVSAYASEWLRDKFIESLKKDPFYGGGL